MICPVSTERTVPGEYMVRLKCGHSFEDPRPAVGSAMYDIQVGHLVKFIWRGAIACNCAKVSDEILEVIRADPGVEEVHCNVVYARILVALCPHHTTHGETSLNTNNASPCTQPTPIFVSAM
jgi:hypothetical protein